MKTEQINTQKTHPRYTGYIELTAAISVIIELLKCLSWLNWRFK